MANHGYPEGIYHEVTYKGRLYTFANDDVASLHKEVLRLYSDLKYTYQEFSEVQGWLNRAPDRVDTSFMEDKRDKWLTSLRTERKTVVERMSQLLKQGVEPVTPDPQLDVDVSLATNNVLLLRDAAVSLVGGPDAVAEFRLASQDHVNAAVVRAYEAYEKENVQEEEAAEPRAAAAQVEVAPKAAAYVQEEEAAEPRAAQVEVAPKAAAAAWEGQPEAAAFEEGPAAAAVEKENLAAQVEASRKAAKPKAAQMKRKRVDALARQEEKIGVYLSTPETSKLSSNGENSHVCFGLSSMQGWRTTMENAHAAVLDLDDNTSFFGVYDGNGGKCVSKFCARHLHKQVLINDVDSSSDLRASVHKSFLRMDAMMKGQRGWRELSELGDKGEGIIWTPTGDDSDKMVEIWDNQEGSNSNFPGPISGSTACVAVLRNDQLLVANAGDSRCVISRRGQAYNLSTDHKPYLEGEKERILSAGGTVVAGQVNGSLDLSRAIGYMHLKQNQLLPAERQIVTAEPQFETVQLSDDDEFIVLACNGIWECMSSQEVVDFVHEQLKTEDKLSSVCESILNRCVATTSGGEGCDNMTVIVVQFKKPTSADATCSTEQSTAEEEMRPNVLDCPDRPKKYA